MSLMDANEGFARRERLSALVDGEGDGSACAAALRDWCDDADCRRDWHAWQLIGDVLRSEDLASDPRRDVDLCSAVRARLAAEPVVLAPAPLRADGSQPGRQRPGRLTIASAVAAGFVLVVGSITLLRPGEPARPEGRALALADRATLPASAQPSTTVATASPGGPARPGETAAGNGVVSGVVGTERPASHEPVARVDRAAGRAPTLIRDPELDRYLVAHKQFAGTSALGVPSAFLRSATVETPPR